MIPQAVIMKASTREHLGGKLEAIGKYHGMDVFTYVYSVPMTIGMPELYLWDGKKVKVIDGVKAISIISSFSPSSQ